MTSSNVVLSVNNVKKKIGNRLIIKGISFEVYAGEIFGFLGPNGSGKTTTIRMLVDLIRPTEGSIQICGFDAQKQHNDAMNHVGCIVENPELYPYMTGWENLEHFARMLPGITEKRIHEVAEIVGMDARIQDKVKTYSLGMRQRLGIAQALLGSPKLLILDEPTNGLDPQGIKELREFIRKLADSGLSVFVSSHLLSEIQLMCDRVAIISKGEVISVGEVNELIGQASKTYVWNVAPGDIAEKVLETRQDVQVLTRTQPELGEPFEKFTVEMDSDTIPMMTETMVRSGVRIYSIETKNPTLEELFLRLTEGERID